MADHRVVVAILALEAVHDGAVCAGHVVVGFLAVGRRQPSFLLAGEQVERLQNVVIRECDVASAFFVESGGEVAELHVLALSALLGGFERCPEFVAVVLLAVRVEMVQGALDS